MYNLIDRVTRLTKTDIRYLMSGGSVMVVGQIFVAIIAFGLSIAFANLLPKDLYGTYQYIITVAEFILIFSLTGFSKSVIRSVAKGFEGTLAYAFKKYLSWSLAAVAFGLTIGCYYLFKDNEALGYGIIIASAAAPIINAAKLYIAHLNGKKLFLRSSISIAIGNLIPAILLILVLLRTDNVLYILATYFISHATINIFLYTINKRTVENNQTEQATLSLAKHLSLQAIVLKIAAQVDKIMLFQFSGSVILAEYVFSVIVPRQFQYFFKSVKSVVLPKTSIRSYAVLRETLPRKIILLYGMILPITCVYILIAPALFEVFFPQYSSAVIYSQIYSLIFLALPTNIIKDVFIGHAKSAVLYKVTVASSTVKILTAVVLIPFYGIWGVLSSVLITQLISSAFLIFYFYKTKE